MPGSVAHLGPGLPRGVSGRCGIRAVGPDLVQGVLGPGDRGDGPVGGARALAGRDHGVLLALDGQQAASERLGHADAGVASW
jgi:hypothetical protein